MLTINNFISVQQDFEIAQYKILAGLKDYQEQLNKKRIFPALKELINLLNQLDDIQRQKDNLKISFPKQIKGYDVITKKLIFEETEDLQHDVELLFDLINWARPVIKSIIEEGIILYDFVEKNLLVEEIGILPIYKSEGYLIVADNISFILQVYRFEYAILSSGTVPFRELKTRIVQKYPKGSLTETPEKIKLDLIKKYSDLPNPATYYYYTDLDFPFNETILPITKRKHIQKYIS